MFPLAPDRFSTTTCCPSFRVSSAASRRAGMSIDPPAANGTTIMMGCAGQSGTAAINDAGIIRSAAKAKDAIRYGTNLSTLFDVRPHGPSPDDAGAHVS